MGEAVRETNVETQDMLLNNPTLLRRDAFIGGKWRAAEGNGVITVTNPATRTIVGTVPRFRAADAGSYCGSGRGGIRVAPDTCKGTLRYSAPLVRADARECR